MDPNPDYHIYNAKAIAKAIGYAFPVIIYIIVRIWNFISKSKKQADETTFANDTSAVKSNATQITMPVVPSAAATIPPQISVVTANSTQRDQRDNNHRNEMPEAKKRAAHAQIKPIAAAASLRTWKRATQARIKQSDEIAKVNDIHVETANANQTTLLMSTSTDSTIQPQIPAVTDNATQRDQPSNNYINEMMEAEKRAVEAEKRAVEAEKRAAKAKKQATAAKKQADGTTLANATQTTVPVAPSAAPAVPPRSLDERINALLKMKASGLITDAEFDQKRKELLDSI